MKVRKPILLIRQFRSNAPLKIEESVAIIGNSDLLTEDKTGAEIDNHDVVIRFNLAAMSRDLADCVGNKTSIVLFSQNITTHWFPHAEELQQQFKKYCRQCKVICYPGHEKNILPYNSRPYFLLIDVPTVNAVFQRLLPGNQHLFSSRHHPRNGIKLLACLTDEGVVPDLYGFDLFDRGNNKHYFDDEIQAETPERGHKPSVEFALLRALADKGLVNIK